VHLFGHDTDILGVAFFLVIVGTLALILAAIQYQRDMRLVRSRSSGLPPVTFVVAILLSGLGLFVFTDLVRRF